MFLQFFPGFPLQKRVRIAAFGACHLMRSFLLAGSHALIFTGGLKTGTPFSCRVAIQRMA